MAKKAGKIGRTLLIGASIAVAFVIVVFAACNFFATGGLTWSLIPILSVLLGYLSFIPILGWGRSGVLWSMGVLSVLYVPFVALICLITNSMDSAFVIAVTFSTIGMVYLWCIVLSLWLFWHRPRIAVALIFFTGAIVAYTSTLAMQAVLPQYAANIEGWQFVAVITFVPAGAIFAGIEYVRYVQQTRREVEVAEKKARRKAARKGR